MMLTGDLQFKAGFTVSDCKLIFKWYSMKWMETNCWKKGKKKKIQNSKTLKKISKCDCTKYFMTCKKHWYVPLNHTFRDQSFTLFATVHEGFSGEIICAK